jgi:hypothetical protein
MNGKTLTKVLRYIRRYYGYVAFSLITAADSHGKCHRLHAVTGKC